MARIGSVCGGPTRQRGWDDAFADEGCRLLAPGETDPLTCAQAFAKWALEERIDIVIPMDGSIAASAVALLRIGNSRRMRL